MGIRSAVMRRLLSLSRLLTWSCLLPAIAVATSWSFAAEAAAVKAGSDPSWPAQGPELVVKQNTAKITESENLEVVKAFLEEGKYKGWAHDPYIRPTGDYYHTPDGALIDGTTHHRVRIYYSPAVEEWLKKGRPAATQKNSNPLPDRSMIVKEMYATQPPFYPVEDPVIGWAAMVKNAAASHGGWYWVIYFKEQFRSMATVGEWSYSFCLTCHASTEGENTFSSLDNLLGKDAATNEGRSIVVVANPLFPITESGMSDSGPAPRESIAPAFERQYTSPEIYPMNEVPSYKSEDVGLGFPSTKWDHVWNRAVPADRSYITSDNCVGCHDATLLVETEVPNMLIQDPALDGTSGERSKDQLNLSIYSEWRSSPMGMAGRDPFFFAQLESEIHLYPEDAPYIENLCLSCHGAMGQRQYHEDRARFAREGKWKDPNFKLDWVFETGQGPHATYGALAREGISCMVCHQMDPASVKERVHSGKFQRAQWDVIYGPTSESADSGGAIRTYPMKQALGFTPKYDPYLAKSEMCGTCHTILLDVLDPQEGPYHAHDPVKDDGSVLMSRAHEQDTYSEWRYSAYNPENPDPTAAKGPFRTCQECHMSSTYEDNPTPLDFKVANIQDTSWPIPAARNLAPAEEITVPTRVDFKRHVFFGMNLFVLNMYQQFGDDVFGLEMDPNPPMSAVDTKQLAIDQGEWQIANRTASVELTRVERQDDALVAQVRVTNQGGHRLPSGVGFRRAWVELTVRDEKGAILWGSGVTDSQGVILGSDGKPLASEFTYDYRELQPHWQEIRSQDAVQIYEERYVNKYPKYGDELRLNTSFLGIGRTVKENRLEPLGYAAGFLREKLKQARTDEERWTYQQLLPASEIPADETRGIAVDPSEDPEYLDGSGTDSLTYRIPLSALAGAASVHASLNYQNIPPNWLRDRFELGRGEQAQRLYYLVGHLQTEGTSIQEWKIRIAKAQARIPRP